MSEGFKLIKIAKSTRQDKKYDAFFREKECPCPIDKKPCCGAKEYKVSFGAKGMSDYTIHKDKERKRRYIERHSGMNENWDEPMTPGALSRWILWNKPTLEASIKDFKNKFNL